MKNAIEWFKEKGFTFDDKITIKDVIDLQDDARNDGLAAARGINGNLNGVALIAIERLRQITKEGWTTEHDDSHTGSQLRDAAECYLFELRSRNAVVHIHQTPPSAWPWDREWWKPTHDNVRQLVKAGALIAAEIDRLQRQITP